MSYTSQNGLPKVSTKYSCMVSGEKRMAPCSGCTKPSGCLTSTMQYKEKDEMADKPIVQLLADGTIKCAKALPISECGYKPGQKVCGKCGAAAETIAAKSEDWVTAETPEVKGGMSPMESMASDVEDELDSDPIAKRKKARKKRMETMGVKSGEFDDDAFVCAFERKMLAGNSQVCAQCPGGCASEADMPSLLEVEGIAEDMFSGKVLDSAYADETDIFIVDVQRKDGKPVEIFFDGTSGEVMGWHLLNEKVLGEVAEIAGERVISFNEAADIAVKSIEGEVISVDADMFEGYDAYAVEVEGDDGKSYDVFVSLDGEVLGWDEYDASEAEDIDAEVADLALKAMYGDEERMEMAKGGMAMPDGSYPIKDEEDLKNAIMAVGRASNPDEVKMHCQKRAKELGKEDMIPDSWDEEAEKPKEEMAEGEKSAEDAEATKLLADLLEFEMLTIEEGI
jgi:uncharacterized membrane protein YkoI